MATIFRFPTSLGSPIVEGYDESGDDGVLRTTVQNGPTKLRPLGSPPPADVTATLLVGKAGMQVLDDFYWITLGRTRKFYWKDHRRPIVADNATVYRFNGRPKYSPEAPELWLATMTLERLGNVQGHFLLNFNDDVHQPTT